MKIAFDENVPLDIANALSALSGESKLLRVEIVSARDFAPPKAESDVPWLEAFARSGGNVIVSGDAKMRGKLHEQQALREAGFTVFFMARQWNQLRSYDKCAMLIRWWPLILKRIASAEPGEFFEIPCSWTGTEMKEVTPPSGLREKPGRKPKSKK